MDEYLKVLTDFIRNLNYEIAQQKDPIGLMFLVNQSLKGRISENDRAEVKGYYGGLKVSKSILRKVLCCTAEENGYTDGESCDGCAFLQLCNEIEGKETESEYKEGKSAGHKFTVAEKYKNVTVEILECSECGERSIGWYAQEDTEKIE